VHTKTRQRAKTVDDGVALEERRATTAQDARNGGAECYGTLSKEVVLESADLDLCIFRD
jgi:hypothetical protein